jgi:predicted lipoprotein with Yx(FWY)xxD motif
VRRLIVLALAAVLAVSALTGMAIAASKPTKPATLKTRTAGDLGKIIVDGRSRTLYLFEKDKNGKSACSGACAEAWPPLLTKGKPKASGSVKASRLATTKRSDGTTQVTYGGHPLYTFAPDKNKPGSTKGQGVDGFGAEWYVVGTNGKKIEDEG